MRLEAVTLDAVGTLIAVAEPIGRLIHLDREGHRGPLQRQPYAIERFAERIELGKKWS